jgi:hypothetical protein
MNKFKTILIFSIAVLGAGFLFALPVYAQPIDPLVVQFQTTPLFNEASFLPGDTVTRSAIVTNNSGQTQRIGTQAINVSDPDHLGNVLNLEIKEGLTTLYTGTLSAFFAAGEIYLSELANGATTTYYYSITFDLNAGDNYQGKGLGFDIAVGFLGESISQQVSSEGGGGGGGGTSTAGLIIFDEAITVAADTATITWKTNLNSTSRVIYSPSPAPVFDITNPPNYNYTYSTTEDVTKVMNHTVVINGLAPATTYFFRCVSHNSPDTLSPEYSFATLNPGETPTENEQQLGEQMGEVAGAAIIRTALPETGGIIDKIAKAAGLSSTKSNEFKINLLIAGGLIFIWIVLFLIRWGIKHQKT